MKLLKLEVENHGIAADHNMPCCVFTETEPAVFNCNIGIFEPSWKAQAEGFTLLRIKNNFIRNILLKLFGVEV